MVLANILAKIRRLFERCNEKVRGVAMLILSVSEAKRQIKDLVEQVGRRNQVYYITPYSRPKVVMLSVDQLPCGIDVSPVGVWPVIVARSATVCVGSLWAAM